MDLRLQHVIKRFGDKLAVDVPTLTIRSGEFFTFVGPSGCGKTTSLNLIAGLEDPSGGQLWLGDQLLNELPPHKRNIAFVFQSYALYPHRTVAENLAFPLQMAKLRKPVIEARVQEAAELLGLAPLLEKYPRQLSGGERQRVALGRAIVRQPKLFLFDEPLSNLDAPLRAQMRKELKHLHQRLDTTFVYVTHDQEEALSLSDRIAVMRAGRIEQSGAPDEVYSRPANRFVASFFGTPPMNFMQGTISIDEGRLRIRVGERSICIEGSTVRPEQISAVTVGFRPEDLRLSRRAPGAGSWCGSVSLVELHGSQCYLEIDIAGETVTGVAAPQDGYVVNETVWIAPSRLHLFNSGNGERID